MASEPLTQSQHIQSDAGAVVRAGGWLFRQRTLTPIPLVLAILFVHAGEAPPSTAVIYAGVALVFGGEALRLWGVHHIGVISRTRSDRLGPLIDSGPFAYARNPLYLGNIALWTGFAIAARLVWLAPVIAVLLLLQYHAIVRWEEQLLTARLGDAYREYQRRVSRWIPRLSTVRRNADPTSVGDNAGRGSGVGRGVRLQPDHRWGPTFFSERGTLIAIAAGFFLIWLKARF